MTYMRRAARRDTNENELISLAMMLGAQWERLGPLDGWRWHPRLQRWDPVEIKRPERKGRKSEYTDAQLAFFHKCRMHGSTWIVWRTSSDVLADMQRTK